MLTAQVPDPVGVNLSRSINMRDLTHLVDPYDKKKNLIPVAKQVQKIVPKLIVSC